MSSWMLVVEVNVEKNKKRKRTTLILLAMLALLIGLLIPFTWRSFKTVKASLMQSGRSEAFSTNIMHGGWVPSSTPTNRPTSTFTASIPPSQTSTMFTTATTSPFPNSTATNTVTVEATETHETISTPTLGITKTMQPSPTATTSTGVPLGGTYTPPFSNTSTPTSTLTPTEIPILSSPPPTKTEPQPTSPPSMLPTVGPGGNPGDYSTLGFVFGLIAVAAFLLYFYGTIVSKRDHS